MKLLNLDSSKTYSIPDLYLNIGHLLDHFMMLIFAKAAFDAGREFGLSYEEIIIYGTLGVVLFGAAAPLAGWLADKFSRAILILSLIHISEPTRQATSRMPSSA